MSVQNPERLATKQDLKDMYDRIRPYMGGLPEVVANKFSKGDLYSTEEKMIGQWINGKPLYQRVFSFTAPSQEATIAYVIEDGDVEQIIDIKGYGAYDNIDQYYQTLSTYNGVDERGITAFTCHETSNQYYGDILIGLKGTIFFNKPMVISLQYTKISDTAISIGTDTDYSTEEKIIGTWITGEPLYQRTFSLSSVSVSSGTSEINITDFTGLTFINACGYIKYSDNTYYSVPYTDSAEYCYVAKYGSRSNLQLIYHRNSGNATFDVLITVQYTKTT